MHIVTTPSVFKKSSNNNYPSPSSSSSTSNPTMPSNVSLPSSSNSNTKSSISVNENEYNLLLLLFFALFFCIAIVATLIKLRTHQQKNQKEPADILLAWIRQLNNKETQEQDRDKIMVVVNESTTNNCTSIESGECLLIKQQINQLEEKLTDRLIILNQFCISSELTKQLNNGLKAVQNDAKLVIHKTVEYFFKLKNKKAPLQFTSCLINSILPSQLLVLAYVCKWRIRVRDSFSSGENHQDATEEQNLTNGKQRQKRTTFLIPDLPNDMKAKENHNMKENEENEENDKELVINIKSMTTSASTSSFQTNPISISVIKSSEYNNVCQALLASQKQMQEAIYSMKKLKHFHKSGRLYVKNMLKQINELVSEQLNELQKEKDKVKEQSQALIEGQSKTAIQLKEMLSSVQNDVLQIVTQLDKKQKRNIKTKNKISSSSVSPSLVMMPNKHFNTKIETSTSVVDNTIDILYQEANTVAARVWLNLLSNQQKTFEHIAAKKLQSMWRKKKMIFSLNTIQNKYTVKEKRKKIQHQIMEGKKEKYNIIESVVSEIAVALECVEKLEQIEIEINDTLLSESQIQHFMELIQKGHHRHHHLYPLWNHASSCQQVGYAVNVMEMKITDQLVQMLHEKSKQKSEKKNKSKKKKENRNESPINWRNNDNDNDKDIDEDARVEIIQNNNNDKHVAPSVISAVDIQKYRVHFRHIGKERIQKLFNKGKDHVSLPEEVLWRLFNKLCIPREAFDEIFLELRLIDHDRSDDGNGRVEVTDFVAWMYSNEIFQTKPED